MAAGSLLVESLEEGRRGVARRGELTGLAATFEGGGYQPAATVGLGRVRQHAPIVVDETQDVGRPELLGAVLRLVRRDLRVVHQGEQVSSPLGGALGDGRGVV